MMFGDEEHAMCLLRPNLFVIWHVFFAFAMQFETKLLEERLCNLFEVCLQLHNGEALFLLYLSLRMMKG
jgi:hypothetical protein